MQRQSRSNSCTKALCYCLIAFQFQCLCAFLVQPIANHGGRASFATTLQASPNDQQYAEPKPGVILENILHEYGYGRCIVTLKSNDLPLVAELFENGQSSLVAIDSFVATDEEAEPKALVRYLFQSNHVDCGSTKHRRVSLADITTIWLDPRQTMSAKDTMALRQQLESIQAPRKERALDRLYNSRVGTSRSPAKGISKKKVGEVAQKYFGTIQQHQSWAESVIRQVIKAGVGFSRLVSSDTVHSFLYNQENGQQDSLKRATAAIVVSQDSTRFKRFPCLALHAHACDGEVLTVTIINGGWLVMDHSVRAGAEGRIFVELCEERSTTTTLADERIIRRLECLALGEAFSTEDLQVDVREALKGMQLPITRKGATDALVRIGRWSGNEDLSRLAPWSVDVLKAASWFVEWTSNQTKEAALSDERTDLSMYPCLCIDSERTAFRDDAISVRPRSATGRPVVPEASKWEVLVHIVDASVIYGEATDLAGPLSCLKGAAESRVSSRYDLPQPLHLMPPRVLRNLSFNSERDFHRCVTLWAYIDERNGRLIDAGLERSVVGPAKILSYDEATSIMGDRESTNSTERAMLLVIERLLSMWSKHRMQQDDNARKREARLNDREISGKSVYADNVGDSSSFQRTRGHRLVDSALDLHGLALYNLLSRADVAIPMAKGAEVTRGGRLATAPLRRYLDGMAQVQALAALCDYGNRLTPYECRQAGKLANAARNAFSNVRAQKHR